MDMETRVKNLELDVIALNEAVKIHARILQGDKSLDVPPLMERLSMLQETIEKIHNQWIRMRMWACVFGVSLVVALVGIFVLLLR